MRQLSPEPRLPWLMLFVTSCFKQEIGFRDTICVTYKYNDDEREEWEFGQNKHLSLSGFFAFPSLCLTRFIPSARNQDVSFCAPHKTHFGVKASLGIVCWWLRPAACLMIEMQEVDVWETRPCHSRSSTWKNSALYILFQESSLVFPLC